MRTREAEGGGERVYITVSPHEPTREGGRRLYLSAPQRMPNTVLRDDGVGVSLAQQPQDLLC